jgi:D-tyrosyl-tRNA(Tyr) deacylase
MRAVVQRVSQASVSIDGIQTAAIGQGLLVLLGITHTNTRKNAEALAIKLIGLRIFSDTEDRMNLSVQDIGGSIMVISNFTLYANSRKGFRPNFMGAAPPDVAEPLYDYFVEYLRSQSSIEIQTGIFGAMMDVSLTNDGPVTIILDYDNT